jgi:CRP-like cAMP-binding protein
VELLASCRGLEDLPPETQTELAAKATLERLAPEQEVSGFGLAIVAKGDVAVMPTIAEAACGYARRGEPVFSRGNLAEGVSLRVVALADGAEVAVLRAQDFEHMLETCPWVAEELRSVADRFQALAGVAMGPLGERLDDSMRAMITDRCEVRLLEAGDVLMEEGKPVAGLHVVGGGKLETVTGGRVTGELVPGDLAFASAVLSHAPASATLRAAAGGALIVVADRMPTHELLVSVPPLLELLATS